jgi:hypothetical protein
MQGQKAGQSQQGRKLALGRCCYLLSLLRHYPDVVLHGNCGHPPKALEDKCELSQTAEMALVLALWKTQFYLPFHAEPKPQPLALLHFQDLPVAALWQVHSCGAHQPHQDAPDQPHDLR